VKTPLRAESIAGGSRIFGARAARAEYLASEPSVDAEPLRFAALLYRAQGEAAAAIESLHRVRALAGDPAVDVATISAPLRSILRTLAHGAPPAVAASALARAEEDDRTFATRLDVYWKRDLASAEDGVSRSILRPYAETLRVLSVPLQRARTPGRCPACGGAAGIGRRRSAENQGAVRTLLCALCGLEWATPRILCPCCAERDPKKLPSFTSERHPEVRIEACETCRRYVKTIDTTLDERILPEVDDLRSLALDLWARIEGLERLEPGIAGI
jgi:FdhE protein